MALAGVDKAAAPRSAMAPSQAVVLLRICTGNASSDRFFDRSLAASAPSEKLPRAFAPLATEVELHEYDKLITIL
jgi:hypothetical protein